MLNYARRIVWLCGAGIIYLHVGTVPVDDLQGLLNGWFTEVPILIPVKSPQFVLERQHIDILVIIEMAKPPANKYN